jgi:hypothetical protein
MSQLSEDACISTFNDQLARLQNMIKGIYHDNIKVNTYCNTIDTLVKFNRTIAIVRFYKHVYLDFKDQIMAEKESFFLNELKLDGLIGDKDKLSDAYQFKNLWLSERMTKNIKKDIWSYFQVFVKLCDKFKPYYKDPDAKK